MSIAVPLPAVAWHEPPASTFTSAELSYLRERLTQNGVDRALDRNVSDALGLTQEGGPSLNLRYLGIVDPSRGDSYFYALLPDHRTLLGRRETTGRIYYWLVVSGSVPSPAILAIAERTAPLPEDQADVELRRIVAFLRSSVPLRSSDQ